MKLPLIFALLALCLHGPAAWSQETAPIDSESERGAAVDRALQLVEQYVASEQAEAGERVSSRSEMLAFKFRSTRENGRYQLLSESAWREWERERSEDREIRRLILMGDPTVERLGDGRMLVHCAVHLSALEKDGDPWEGVSLRSFEVQLDDVGEPRIRHEKLLANRAGIQPGSWKRLKKKDTPGTRSNLRSSPTTRRNNVIGKIENGETMHVWDQDDEGWLLVRTEEGLLGFLHRSQIDFESSPGPSGGSDGEVSRPRPKNQPFGVPLPGKPGFVLNPYTNSVVDVRDLRAGTLVRDPNDPVKDRAFRVPLSGTPSRAVIVEEE